MPEAVERAEQLYVRCRERPELRHCLVARHRELMMRGNQRFWSETAAY
jgi:hypothetical protein